MPRIRPGVNQEPWECRRWKTRTSTQIPTLTHVHLPPLERMVYQKDKATSSLNDYYMHPMLCKMLHFFAHGTSCILTMVIPSTIICCKANHLVACRFVYSSVFLTRLCTNFGWKSPLFLIMTVLLTDSPNEYLLISSMDQVDAKHR